MHSVTSWANPIQDVFDGGRYARGQHTVVQRCCTLYFADAAGLFPSALPLLPKESRQDNYPLLREKSRKSNKTSTVVWYFHSPIQGVSLFRYSLAFLWIVLSGQTKMVESAKRMHRVCGHVQAAVQDRFSCR